MEMAALRRIERAWHLAFEDLAGALRFDLPARDRHGREQCLCIRVQRIGVEPLLWRNLDSEAFQGAGIEPSHIAEATLDAILENRFYVFRSEGVEFYLNSLLAPILKAENPLVITWGPDLRSSTG